MKKRNMILGGLLVAVAITSYAVSGTYAKYTSKVDVTDTARVAKWGMGEHTVDLFTNSYKNTAGANVVASNTCKTNASGDPVDADGNVVTGTPEEILAGCVKEDVVAPGTAGFYAFDLSKFAPETNYIIDVEEAATPSVDTIGKINYYVKKVSATDYKALVDDGNANYAGIFTEATKEVVDGSPYLYVGKDITAIATALNDKAFDKVLAANTADSNVYVIGWDWAYEIEDNADPDDGSEKDINNMSDTDLGNGKITYNGTDYTDVATDKVPTYGKVELNIKVTASQTQLGVGLDKTTATDNLGPATK